MKLGKISPLAFSRMRERGISMDALNHLLAHGEIEKRFDDGAQVVTLDCADYRPKRTLYAVVDAAGEVLTVEKRVRSRR